MTRLGLIADTHGLIRPQALVALEGCDRILHAGDIGEGDILEALAAIAPVEAVPGNCDDRPGLPPDRILDVGGVRILLRHGHLPEPGGHGADVVVSGHTHVPLVFRDGATLRVNPGSAGPRRFRLPVTVAILELGEGEPRAEILELDLGP